MSRLSSSVAAAVVALVALSALGCGGVDDDDATPMLLSGERDRSVAQSPAALIPNEVCTQLALQDTAQAHWIFRSASSLWANEISSRYVTARYREVDVRFQLEDAADLFTNATGRYFVEGYELLSRDGAQVVGRAMVIEGPPVDYVATSSAAAQSADQAASRGRRGFMAAVLYLGDAAAAPGATEPCRRVTSLEGLQRGQCYWLDARGGSLCF